MISRVFGASRSSFRLVSGRQLCRTYISPTAPRRADLVQDLYLRELKAFKPTPIKASDADGHVRKFSAPSAPRSPEEANIANDLKAYEDQQVEVEGRSASDEKAAKEWDWFEEEWLEDEEEDKSTAH